MVFRDPRFIREFKAKHCMEVFATHAVNKSKSVMVLFFFFSSIELIYFSFLGRNCGDARINPSLSIPTKSRQYSCCKFRCDQLLSDLACNLTIPTLNQLALLIKAWLNVKVRDLLIDLRTIRSCRC